MALSRNIETYDDVRAALDAAVTAGGGRVRFEAAKAAIRWRQRANFLRSLIAQRDGGTPWDDYQLLLDGTTVLIMKRAVPTVESLDGEVLDPAIETDRDLLEEAEALKRRLNIE